MNDRKRLELIVKAIRYCQHVKAMGMPAAAYSKALREPVYFLWECRDGLSKERRPKVRSTGALGMHCGSGVLIYDHAVPLRYLQEQLLSLSSVTTRSVRRVLDKYGIVVLITKDEDRRLSTAGFRSRMPDDWDGRDALARYKAVGIELVSNVSIAAAPERARRIRCSRGR